MRTLSEMKAAIDANNARQNKNFLSDLVDEIISEMHECETSGCSNLVEADDDICHGCEADMSHRALWGSGIPMSHHKPS